MVLSLRKIVGTRLLLLFVGLVAGFLALVNITPANAVTTNGQATWIDSTTIRYNGVDFRGPTKKTLNIDTDGNTAEFQVFSITSGSSILFFRMDQDMATANQIAVNDNTSAIDAAVVGLTNTRGSVPAGTTPASPAPAASADTCTVSGVGWIVCPVANFLSTITDAAYNLVEKLLVFKFAENALDTNNTVYKIWSSVRNLANVAFLFVFMMIIFSQATSIGISNYGVKKMLPRLIVAAILVNLSYFLCVFAIDVSNILGAGVDGIITSVPFTAIEENRDTWSEVISALLAGGAAAAAIGITAGVTGAGAAVLSMALPFLVIALFAILTALVVLVARQAILILLVVIAPLAFVAYVLPNTEDSFTRWRKIFTTMLIFYPLVALVFSGAKVAAAVLREANGGGVTGGLISVMSLAVQAFPLFALPFILKFSGGLLGRIAGMVNNPNKGPFDALRKGAERKRDVSVANARARNAAKQPIDYTGRRFGAQRSALSKASQSTWFSASRGAKSRINREQELSAAKAREAKAATGYYANRIGEDEEFANKMAGGSRLVSANAADLARLRGAANEAIIKLNAEEVATHTPNLNRNGATLAAAGIQMTTDGRLFDRTGANISYATASSISKIPLDPTGKFDIETEAALKYASQNRLSSTVNGAKALASTLAATGNLTSQSANDLVMNVQNVSPEEKSFLTAHINSEASKAGLKHLSYNTVDVNGNFQLGGQFAGPGGVVNRLMQNGASTITKEMYKDPTMGNMLAQAVTNLEATNKRTFETELIKMDPRKIQSMVEAKGDAGLLPPGTTTATAIDDYVKMRAKAIKKYGMVD